MKVQIIRIINVKLNVLININIILVDSVQTAQNLSLCHMFKMEAVLFSVLKIDLQNQEQMFVLLNVMMDKNIKYLMMVNIVLKNVIIFQDLIKLYLK